MATKHRKNSRKTWFREIRGSYLPSSWQGWLSYVPYTAYIVGILVFALQNSVDLLHAIPIIVPNWLVALITMTWLAEHKS